MKNFKILNIYLVIFIFAFTSKATGQVCVWEHYSEIDCDYNLTVGFTCNCGYTTHHHPFASSFYCPTDCGCWGFQGFSMRSAGCRGCGWKADSLCALNGNSVQKAHKFLQTGSKVKHVSPIPGTIAYNWRDAYDPDSECGILPTTICCDLAIPDNCFTCACGVAEIDWENSQTYIRAAHDPYYPPCPKP